MATAVHGKKQYTALAKIPKEDVCAELQSVLEKQQRWTNASGSVRVTGGNEGAESLWGTSKMNQKQRCVHRGSSAAHSHSHGLCSVYLSKHPGIESFAAATKSVYAETIDKTPPENFFTSSGWSGMGSRCDDETTQMIAGALHKFSPRFRGPKAPAAGKPTTEVLCTPVGRKPAGHRNQPTPEKARMPPAKRKCSAPPAVPGGAVVRKRPASMG